MKSPEFITEYEYNKLQTHEKLLHIEEWFKNEITLQEFQRLFWICFLILFCYFKNVHKTPLYSFKMIAKTDFLINENIETIKTSLKTQQKSVKTFNWFTKITYSFHLTKEID